MHGFQPTKGMGRPVLVAEILRSFILSFPFFPLDVITMVLQPEAQ